MAIKRKEFKFSVEGLESELELSQDGFFLVATYRGEVERFDTATPYAEMRELQSASQKIVDAKEEDGVDTLLALTPTRHHEFLMTLPTGDMVELITAYTRAIAEVNGIEIEEEETPLEK